MTRNNQSLRTEKARSLSKHNSETLSGLSDLYHFLEYSERVRRL